MSTVQVSLVAFTVCALWAAGEYAWDKARRRRSSRRRTAARLHGLHAVITAEHLVSDAYQRLGDLYDTPPPSRGGGRHP